MNLVFTLCLNYYMSIVLISRMASVKCKFLFKGTEIECKSVCHVLCMYVCICACMN